MAELEKLMVRLVGDGSSYQRMLDGAVAATKTASTQIAAVTASNRSAMGQFTAGAGSLMSAAKAAGHALNFDIGNGLRAIGDRISSVGSSMRSFGGNLTTYVTLPLGAAAAACLKFAADAETTAIQFEVMLGKDKGAALLKNLRAFADTTPFQFGEVSTAAKTMLSFGVAQESVLPTMRMLGDVAAGTGADIKSLSVIFGQIKGLGKLQGQDFHQLVNAGVDVSEIAKVMGTDMGGLMELMKDGQVPFQAVQEAFRRMSAEGGKYHNMTERLGKSTAGQWSTLLDSIQALAVSFGNELLPVAREFMDYLSAVIEYFKMLSPEVKRQIIYTAALAAAMGPLIWAFGTVATVIGTAISFGASWIGICAGMVVAALAVLDILGVTQTGFGKLFNSIRIDGTGLGTWMGAFVVWMAQIWNGLVAGIEYGWVVLVASLKAILYPFFDWYLAKIEDIAQGLISLNRLLPKKLQFDTTTASHVVNKIRMDRADRNAEIPEAFRKASNIMLEAEKKNLRLEASMKKLFVADPQDNTTGISFDRQKAMDGLKDIGKTIMSVAGISLDKFLAQFPEFKVPEPRAVGGGALEKWDGVAKKSGATSKPEKNQEFQQVALNRISIAGLAGFRTKKNETEDKGTHHRLDTLIKVAGPRPITH